MTDQPSPPPGGPYPPPPPSAGGTPPPPPGGGALPTESYTPWGTRVLATLIDSIPAVVVYGIGWALAALTTECTESYGYKVCTTSGIGAAAMWLAYLVVLAYVIWNNGYRQGTTGQSIGKGVMKYKVVSETTGQPVGFGMSVVRQLAHILDSFCLVGYLFPLWDAKRQTFADKIMTTICLPA